MKKILCMAIATLAVACDSTNSSVAKDAPGNESSAKTGFYKFEFRKTNESGQFRVFHTATIFHNLDLAKDIIVENGNFKCEQDQRTKNVLCDHPKLQFNKNGNSPIATFQIPGDPTRTGIWSKRAFCETNPDNTDEYTCQEVVASDLPNDSKEKLVTTFFGNAIEGSTCDRGEAGKAVVSIKGKSDAVTISTARWNDDDCFRFVKTVGQSNFLIFYATPTSEGEKVLYIARHGYDHTGFISSDIVDKVWKDRSINLENYMFPECGAIQPALQCAVSFYGAPIPGKGPQRTLLSASRFKKPFLADGLKYNETIQVTSEGRVIDLLLNIELDRPIVTQECRISNDISGVLEFDNPFSGQRERHTKDVGLGNQSGTLVQGYMAINRYGTILVDGLKLLDDSSINTDGVANNYQIFCQVEGINLLD